MFALLPAQCVCVCKSYIVFVLLPAQWSVCVSVVLCLLNVLPAQFAVWATISPLIVIILF